MKILVVNPIMYTCENNNINKIKSLKDTLMYNVCLGFLEKGDTPTLIVAEDFKPEIEDAPFPIVYFPTKFKKIFLPRFIPFLSGFEKYLKENINNFDYVISSESFSLSTFSAVKIFRERCYIWQEMAKHQKKFRQIPSKIWHNFFVRFFYKKSCIVPRSLEAQKFIGKYSKNVSNKIIEHGIDINKFDTKKEKETNQFIVVSQLVERKQIDKIIKAFSDYLDMYNNNYKLVICGTGDQMDYLKELTVKLNKEKNITFLGQCNHDIINTEFKKSKAMLIYTKKDNNMVSIIESISSGTPVITTSIPYNSSYVDDQKLGIVSDIWDYKTLKELTDNFDFYYNNCLNYRYKLSSQHSAELFDKLYEEKSVESE